MTNNTVVIFGANGFLGRYLCQHYCRRGREVVAVGRRQAGLPPDVMFLDWDGRSLGPWALALEGAALVINLAGRSVNCRYDEANRREIMDSRVGTTALIGQAVRNCKVPPRVWMNASTATWYRHATDRPQDECSGEPGEGFSCEVARAWEQGFFDSVVPAATRKLALRIGMVLANEEDSVFDRISGLVRKGLGGTMGRGDQRVSWIHMEDFIAALELLESNPLADGVFNLTAPEAPSNREWMRRFREVLAVPVGLPAASWMLEVGAKIMGTETELVTKSRWVRPRRLEEMGFLWRFPAVGPALLDLRERRGMAGFFEVPVKRAVGSRAWTVRRGLRPA
ncbi:epimerase [Haloferula sp. A504]|uniref:epimerase n=1 Tax=Haloferula sp. A504 TaxID=3373601 RepID=UPI0031C9F56A|nr:DUF1731 domain-containing protein [Verrucomicrobiaceae bacterium E54]